MPEFTLYPQKTVIFINQTVTDAEPQPGSLSFGFCGKKRITDPVHNIMLYAGTGVGYRQYKIVQIPSLFRFCRHGDFFIRIMPRILLVQGIPGIGKDVEQYLLNLLAVAQHLGQIFRKFILQSDPVFFLTGGR